MHLAILVYDGMTALDAVGPYDLLNRIPDLAVVTVGDRPGPKVAQGGLVLHAAHDLADVGAPEVVLVPGGSSGVADQIGNPRVLDWVRTCHETTSWTTSVCTGALILGAAGILRGRRATTHWRAREYLTRFDATYVDERVVTDGKVITGAGVTAGMDLALHLAERLAGRHIAEAIQLSAHYDPDPPFAPIHYGDASAELLETIDERLGPEAPAGR